MFQLVDEHLSEGLSMEMRYHMSQRAFRTVWWLRACDRHFLQALAFHVEREAFAPGERIASVDPMTGDVRLCILEEGTAARTGTLLTSGSFWGDVLLSSKLLRDTRSARSLTYAEIVLFDRQALLQVMSEHPESAKAVRAVALRIAFRRSIRVTAMFARLHAHKAAACADDSTATAVGDAWGGHAPGASLIGASQALQLLKSSGAASLDEGSWRELPSREVVAVPIKEEEEEQKEAEQQEQDEEQPPAKSPHPERKRVRVRFALSGPYTMSDEDAKPPAEEPTSDAAGIDGDRTTPAQNGVAPPSHTDDGDQQPGGGATDEVQAKCQRQRQRRRSEAELVALLAPPLAQSRSGVGWHVPPRAARYDAFGFGTPPHILPGGGFGARPGHGGGGRSGGGIGAQGEQHNGVSHDLPEGSRPRRPGGRSARVLAGCAQRQVQMDRAMAHLSQQWQLVQERVRRIEVALGGTAHADSSGSAPAPASSPDDRGGAFTPTATTTSGVSSGLGVAAAASAKSAASSVATSEETAAAATSTDPVASSAPSAAAAAATATPKSHPAGPLPGTGEDLLVMDGAARDRVQQHIAALFVPSALGRGRSSSGGGGGGGDRSGDACLTSHDSTPSAPIERESTSPAATRSSRAAVGSPLSVRPTQPRRSPGAGGRLKHNVPLLPPRPAMASESPSERSQPSDRTLSALFASIVGLGSDRSHRGGGAPGAASISPAARALAARPTRPSAGLAVPEAFEARLAAAATAASPAARRSKFAPECSAASTSADQVERVLEEFEA